MEYFSSISDKLKEIHRLALEIKEQAAINVEAATTGPVRRYYSNSILHEAQLANIVNPGAGFVRHAIVRAEQFERRLKDGE